MKRLIVLLMVSCLTCAGGADRWPDKPPEVLLAQFGASDNSFDGDGTFCARANVQSTVEILCTSVIARWYMPRAATVRRVAAQVMVSAWSDTDDFACDVELHVDGTVVPSQATEFQMGGIIANDAPFDLAAANESAQIRGLAITVAAGSFLTVVHTTPSDQTNCTGEPTCVCDAADASYNYQVFGRYR